MLVKEIRSEKSKIDKQINELEKQSRKLVEDLGGHQREFSVKNKVITELSKKVSINENDKRKDLVAERLISELAVLLKNLKSDKKTSLEIRIKNELCNLLHKTDFIGSVQVSITDEIVDIQLIDIENRIIEKESLSKGEQQLYASSIIKALVDESEIKFPIFIDSPLQKLDKKHAKNVICKFYPSISSQVVILPLLEKELNQDEYKDLLPKVNQTYFIRSKPNHSYFEQINPKYLFNQTKVEQ